MSTDDKGQPVWEIREMHLRTERDLQKSITKVKGFAEMRKTRVNKTLISRQKYIRGQALACTYTCTDKRMHARDMNDNIHMQQADGH